MAESFGIAYLEAWACQKPVIGSRIGSTECVIEDGVDGALVTPEDPHDLARSIVRLLSDRDTRERMGRAGHAKTVARFTWDKVADKVEQIYQSAHADKVRVRATSGGSTGMNARPAPRVSIVIPAYNSASYIRASLQSVLEQTYSDYEVIVVDDGSVDDTRAAVLAVEGPVRYVYQSNSGPSVARNTGIRAAAGEFICFLDADDAWTPDKLDTQVEFMDQNPQIGLVFADSDEFDEGGVQCRSLLSKSRFYSEIIAGLTDRSRVSEASPRELHPDQHGDGEKAMLRDYWTVRSGAQRTGGSRYVVPCRRLLSNRLHSQDAGPEARGSVERFARRRDHSSIPHSALERSPAPFSAPRTDTNGERSSRIHLCSTGVRPAPKRQDTGRAQGRVEHVQGLARPVRMVSGVEPCPFQLYRPIVRELHVPDQAPVPSQE